MDKVKLAMPTALASVAAAPPNLDSEIVAREVQTQFDLSGNYRSLISERDQNFRLTTANGDRYVVKITGSTETQVVSDFQIGALLHLEIAGLQGVPRVIRTRSGQTHGRIATADNSESCLRVVTYLDGDVLGGCELTLDLACKFGRRIAELDLALQGFSHEGQHQVLLWDTQRAGELLRLCPIIADPAIRELVEIVLTDFNRRVLSSLKTLPLQVIHNDVNTGNVLVDSTGEISGVIDFGDMLNAPRIVELSTALSYLHPGGSDPLPMIAAFVSGYQSANPVTTAEFDVLFDLIRTRLSMTLTILNWRRAARDPDDLYQQKTVGAEQGTIGLLVALSDLGGANFRQHIGEI